MALKIELNGFMSYYGGVRFKGPTKAAEKVGCLLEVQSKRSRETAREIIKEADACCSFSGESKQFHYGNFVSGNSNADGYWRYFFYLHLEYLHLTNELTEQIDTLDRELLDGQTFEEAVNVPFDFLDLRERESAQPPDQSQQLSTNSSEADQSSNITASIDEFVDTSVLTDSAEFIGPRGPWTIRLQSWKPDTVDYEILNLEAAGHNMNTDKQVGVFVQATLLERSHGSEFVYGFNVARVGIRVLGESQSIVEFNRQLRGPQKVGDGNAAVVGDGPTAFIKLDVETGILNGRYALPEIAFVLRPNEERFEVEASLYTLLADGTLRRKDGGKLPSRNRSAIIEALLSRDVHPDDSEEGRLHLVHQSYSVQRVEPEKDDQL